MKTGSKALNLSDLGFLYGLLFTLSLVLINPRGVPYGGIWTTPKLYVVAALAALTWGVLLVSGVRHFLKRRRGEGAETFSPPAGWVVAAGLWLALLVSGGVTIFLSPVTFRSARIANAEMGDGWIYWACVAALVLGNALLLKRFPSLFKAQLVGLLVGGVLSALAVFAQSVNWTLDFTDSSGRILRELPQDRLSLLESGIFRGWMPIGFTSNRGHVGFVLSALTVLVLVCLTHGWLRNRVAWPLYALFLAAVYLTSSRGVLLAFGVGMVYLLVRFWRDPKGRRVMLVAFTPLVLGGVLLASGLVGSGLSRTLPPLRTIIENPFGFTSARSNLWPVAVDGIRARPLFGWGFNGFGLAWPHVNNFDVKWRTYLARQKDNPKKRADVVRIVRNNHSSFEYLGEDGRTYRVPNLTNKAHNIILDTTVSVGLVGFTLYALLFGFFVWLTARGRGWGLEALAVVYVVFGLTWFESAQYSHIVWWALSAGLAFYALPQAAVVRSPQRLESPVTASPNA